MTPVVRSATDRDFSDVVLGAAGPVLVAFQPGLAAADDIDVLARQLPWLTFVRVDAARWPGLASGHRVDRLPALVLFERGVPVVFLGGDRDPAAWRELLSTLSPRP